MRSAASSQNFPHWCRRRKHAVAIATRGAVDFRVSAMLMPKLDAQAWSFARTARVAGACERSPPKLWFRLSVVIRWQR